MGAFRFFGLATVFSLFALTSCHEFTAFMRSPAAFQIEEEILHEVENRVENKDEGKELK